MRSRLPPLCELAPAPAILVWQDADTPAWELNPAAREWAPTQVWQTGEWLAIAHSILAQARAGQAAGADIGRGVRWHAVEVDGAWLAWLIGIPSEGALRDSVLGRPGVVAPRQESQDPQLLQLGLAVGLVGIVLYRIDMMRRRIQLNEWGYRLLGLEPQSDGLPLDDIRALTHPDDWHRIKHAADQAMAGTAMVDTEARYLSFDGTYRTLLTRRIAERDEQGNAVGLIGVSMDVTDQVLERDRALTVAQSIELIAEATGVGVWSADIESGEVAWNGQMRRIYGLSDDMPLQLARAAATEHTHEDDRERVRAAFDQLACGPMARCAGWSAVPAMRKARGGR
jgi:PAS domain-containing protein